MNNNIAPEPVGEITKLIVELGCQLTSLETALADLSDKLSSVLDINPIEGHLAVAIPPMKSPYGATLAQYSAAIEDITCGVNSLRSRVQI